MLQIPKATRKIINFMYIAKDMKATKYLSKHHKEEIIVWEYIFLEHEN